MYIVKWLGQQEDGQDVAEYAVMLAVMLGIAVATLHYIGSSASTTFASIASSIH